MRRRGGHGLLLTLFSTLIAGCHRSPQAQLQKLRQEQASWDATSQLTRELAGRGALPSVYVRQVEEVVERGKQRVKLRAAELSQ